MKILHVADFHYRLDWFSWLTAQAPHYDAIVLAGDLLNQFDKSPGQIEAWSAYLAKFPCSLDRPLFVCSGNHDFFPSFRASARTWAGAQWLRDLGRSGLLVDGQIWPGPPAFGVMPWASQPGETWEWPEAVPIVVVHAPPSGTGLASSADSAGDDGDHEVRAAILDHSPRLVLSGHVHEPRNWHVQLGDTLCLNPGCDLTADQPQHIIIDTSLGQVEWRCPAEGRSESCDFTPFV